MRVEYYVLPDSEVAGHWLLYLRHPHFTMSGFRWKGTPWVGSDWYVVCLGTFRFRWMAWVVGWQLSRFCHGL